MRDRRLEASTISTAGALAAIAEQERDRVRMRANGASSTPPLARARGRPEAKG